MKTSMRNPALVEPTGVYAVMADIRYVDGPLAGFTIREGYYVTYPERILAIGSYRNLQRAVDENRMIKASVTGNRYEIAGNLRWKELMIQ